MSEHKVDSSTIIWAIRYCRSRGTYAYGDGLSLILTHWDDLSENDREVIRRDMYDYLDTGAGFIHDVARVRSLLYGNAEEDQ